MFGRNAKLLSDALKMRQWKTIQVKYHSKLDVVMPGPKKKPPSILSYTHISKYHLRKIQRFPFETWHTLYSASPDRRVKHETLHTICSSFSSISAILSFLFLYQNFVVLFSSNCVARCAYVRNFFVCVVKLLQSPLNGVRKVGLLELEQKMRLAHSISCCLIAL